eukprot:scaffold1028_cov145-Pinguiococcus_pyrenoidosus.AAC.1
MLFNTELAESRVETSGASEVVTESISSTATAGGPNQAPSNSGGLETLEEPTEDKDDRFADDSRTRRAPEEAQVGTILPGSGPDPSGSEQQPSEGKEAAIGLSESSPPTPSDEALRSASAVVSQGASSPAAFTARAQDRGGAASSTGLAGEEGGEEALQLDLPGLVAASDPSSTTLSQPPGAGSRHQEPSTSDRDDPGGAGTEVGTSRGHDPGPATATTPDASETPLVQQSQASFTEGGGEEEVVDVRAGALREDTPSTTTTVDQRDLPRVDFSADPVETIHEDVTNMPETEPSLSPDVTAPAVAGEAPQEEKVTLTTDGVDVEQPIGTTAVDATPRAQASEGKSDEGAFDAHSLPSPPLGGDA